MIYGKCFPPFEICFDCDASVDIFTVGDLINYSFEVWTDIYDQQFQFCLLSLVNALVLPMSGPDCNLLPSNIKDKLMYDTNRRQGERGKRDNTISIKKTLWPTLIPS